MRYLSEAIRLEERKQGNGRAAFIISAVQITSCTRVGGSGRILKSGNCCGYTI